MYFPGHHRPRFLPRAELTRNVFSGLIVGVIAFPLSIALAVAIGMPPVAGLYTAVFAGATASLLGGSKYNITGPTAALVPLLLHVVILHGPSALAIVGVLAGIMLILMGVLHFGRLVRFMPQLVIVGFTAGIAVSIAAGQVNNLLGLTGTDPRLERFHERAWDTVHHLGSIEPASAVIGVASLAFLVAYQSRPRRIPGPLVVVVLATIAVQVLHLDAATVSGRYGALPSGLPVPSLAFLDFGLAFELVPVAASVAVLGAVESLLSAVVADGMSATGERHDSDRELVGLGVANLVAPVMGGIPATAAIARTVAGIRNGATSRLSGVVHAGTVLLLTVGLASVAGDIPLAALAAILLVVAYGIADIPELTKLMRTAPREDLVVLLGTILVTVFFDLTFAIALGVIASTVLLLRRMIRVPVAGALLDEEVEDSQIPVAVTNLVRDHPGVLFFNAQGIISFHSAAAFESTLPRHDPRPLVIRMRDIHHVDSSGLITLQGLIEHRRHAGGSTLLTEVQPEVEAVLKRFGITDLAPNMTARSTEDAIQGLVSRQKLLDDSLAKTPRR